MMKKPFYKKNGKKKKLAGSTVAMEKTKTISAVPGILGLVFKDLNRLVKDICIKPSLVQL